MPPKRRKGRGDDDEDPLASQLAYLKSQAQNGDSDDDARPSKGVEPVLSKKDKKKNKGGKAGDDDAAAAAAAAAQEQAEIEDSRPTYDAGKSNKKDKKGGKGKKGKRGGNDSEDDDDDTSSMATGTTSNSMLPAGGKKGKGGKKGGKGRGDDSEDEAPVTATDMALKSKKGKKGKKGYISEDDDDVDAPVKGGKATTAAAASDDDDDDDENGAATGGGKKLSKKDKKKLAAKQQMQQQQAKPATKGGKKGKRGAIDSDEDLSSMMKKLAAASSSEEEEEEEEENSDSNSEEDEKETPPPPLKKSDKAGKNDKNSGKEDKSKGKGKGGKSTAPIPQKEESEEEDEEEEDEEEEEEEEKPKKGVAFQDGTKPPSPVKEPQRLTPAPPVKTVIDPPLPPPQPQVVEAAPAFIPMLAPKPPAVPAAAAAAAPAPAPAPVPVPAAAPAVAEKKKKPKSKLELKLEAAAKKKEEADAIAAAKKAEEDAANAVVATAQAKEDEKLAAEKKIADDAAAAAAAAAAEGADSAAAAQEKADEEATAGMTQEEIEKEMRMRATMFGDEVQPDYMAPGGGGGDSDAEEEYGKSKNAARSAGKMSKKEKRKAAEAAERKEREVEYNKAMMKASAEGQQFACSQTIVSKDDPMWNNSLDIIIPSFSISAHNKELFVNSELNIVHGRRYGLVAPNGAGKSTLLKMIAAGELKVPPRVDYLYVEQEVVADETAAVDAVLKADKVRWELIIEEKKLLADLEKKADEAKDIRLGEVHEQLDSIGASSAEAKARRILFGLGFDAEMQVRPTKYFSGGWRMRISLARALFIEPTLLMLDEPTNHLDLNAVIWLDDYLQKWKKTLLVVSHDQDFLNSVCQEILHLDQKVLNVYRGNYDTFKEQEATKRSQQQKAWEKQEKKLKELKAKGVTKDNAEKAQIKSKSREPGARSKRADAAAVASGGIESGESQVKLIERPREYLVTFSFPEVLHVPPPILEVRDVNFRYSPKLPWLFRGLNFGLDMGSRVCIVGPNGSGKSTIIKLITEEVKPPEGEVYRNPRLRVGVYNQHFMDRLPMEEDAVTYLRRLFSNETYQSCRNLLGKYGLEGHAHTIPIRDLSGGQKARVVFVELSLMAPHLLFLDEPTNNLDIESIDALCDALKEYNGGVVLVSHDARLIETIEAQLWVVDDQNVTPWASGFDGYRKYLLNKLEEQLAAIMPGSGERPT